MVDIKEEFLDKSMSGIDKNLMRGFKKVGQQAHRLAPPPMMRNR